jgi:copper resistance protein D
MHVVYLIAVWLHVLAAATWIGGMVFLVAVVLPCLRRPAAGDGARELMHAFGVRFRAVAWIALGILVLTGTFNVAHRGYGIASLLSGDLFRAGWGHTLAAKLVLVAGALSLSVIHDFWIGPAATRLAREGGPVERRERFRALAAALGRVNFVFALGILALAVTLVR